ncbi:hypothetical protein A3E73_02500 [Candidatus Beckwithbacteria bacterium RIFCSPHIGHO2_12_FULL_47_17]|uniref:DUF2029 domain-containing protein n=2 Tax=Candidatus Beckwithiibacteriota TaxID=1752726 RepID=A0A1F5DK85_9BACT|nr:MAG: hypothetical protein A3E73_02500 [Candidatus Beckwithbacteria bacterium RIFCSPHIGHO2_12_FULL_47_17]
MKRTWLIFAFLSFFLSRIFILFNPPPNYSDVFHDYRRYAEMWASGIRPYFEHLYEYPPATIPLLYFPEVLNRANIGHYYQNYRLQIFLLDLGISYFVFSTIIKLKTKPISKTLALTFYNLAPLIAKDFFYEGIDWVFVGSLSLAIIFMSKRLLFWILFWLSTGIKLLTAPLALVFIKKDWKLMILGFLLVWGLPLVIFRSSLGVMFVYNNERGIKYAAFPSFVVETINYFTNSETRRDQPPDFEWQGPVSRAAEKVVAIVFPLSLFLVLLYAWRQPMTYAFALKISLIFFLVMFFTAKIFSQPFHLWYVPLIALFPFKSVKIQLMMMGLAFLLLVVDTTSWIRYPAEYKFYVYLLLRYLPMAGLLWLSIKLPSK